MVFPVFRCCSVLTLSEIVSCQPSEQYDEDCDTLTVWLKQGSDLSAFVHCASEDHMKALFDLVKRFLTILFLSYINHGFISLNPFFADYFVSVNCFLIIAKRR